MVLKREFKRNLKALLIWSVVLAGLIFMVMSIYPQFAADQKALDTIMDAYPEALKKAFGIGTLNMGSLLGFYGVEAYMMTTLVGSIYVALLASGMLVKEENDKTVEFLLSKPITRTSVVAQKATAILINIVLLNVIITIASLLSFLMAKGESYSAATFAWLMIATCLLHLSIASISFALSSIMRRSRNIISLSLGIVFVSYFLNIMAGISDKMANLKYVSLFKYVDAASITHDGKMDVLYVWIMIVLILVCVAGAFLYYKQKDIAV